MDMTLIIAVCALLAAYLAFIIIMEKKGWFKQYNISLIGPIIVWRTERGIDFLKKISSPKRFWRYYGSFSVILNIVAMIMMLGMLIWQTWAISGFTQAQKDALPGVEFALVIPGLNPILPLEFLGYIVVALIIAMVIHEFSHGIQSIAHGIKVKSMGIMALIIPIGAFCEPDEEQLRESDPVPRMKVYGAGPTSNFIAVAVSILLFSFILMSGVSVAAPGPSVYGVVSDSPAEGLNLMAGDIITSIDGTNITNTTTFSEALKYTHPGQSIPLVVVRGEQRYQETVTLANKYDYTKNESDNGTGFLGVTPTDIHKSYLQILRNPFEGGYDSFILFYILPLFGYFQNYNPLISPYTNSFVIGGALSALPTGVFWAIVNCIYWIFWLNFAVALFNVLPMIPLDGGYIFNDSMLLIHRKLKPKAKKEDHQRFTRTMTTLCSVMILILIFFPWFVKYL